MLPDAGPSLDTAVRTLAAAFQRDPLMSWAVPSAGRRAAGPPRLFACSVRHGRRQGEVTTVDDGHGASVWMPAARRHLSPIAVVRTGMVALPLFLGPAPGLRLLSHEAHGDEVLDRHARDGDAYLWLVRVDPGRKGSGLGRATVEATQTRMAATGATGCLLKTENPVNVGLYGHLGFDFVDEFTGRPSGLPVWVFRRDLG